MAKGRSKYVEALQRLSRERVEGLQAFETLLGLKEGNPSPASEDRASVLIAVSIVEQALEDALCMKFPKITDITRKKIFDGDSDSGGILGSIYSRSLIAHALGIVGPNVLADLNTLRVIRNAVAHSRQAKLLSETPFKEMCEFRILERLFRNEVDKSALESPRNKIISVSSIIFIHMVLFCRSGDDDKLFRIYSRFYG